MRLPKKSSAAYRLAHEAYAAYGVHTETAIAKALAMPISLHCWQADDIRGLKTPQNDLDSGSIIAAGDYPDRARNGDEMRADLDLVLKFLPGRHQLNLHTFYAETGKERVDRDQLEPGHFSAWLAWAKDRTIGLDFNPTYFAHPKADSGFTLSHADPAIRKFWIGHGRASRRIAQHFAQKLGTPCVNNHWVPDGTREAPADRWAPRARLVESYDAIVADKNVQRALCVDAVEGRLLALGSESYVVGSQELHSSYAQSRGLVLGLDFGHEHPTESGADNVAALMQFHPRLLLHTRWAVQRDSDQVVKLDDPVHALFLEIARGRVWDCVFAALDLFWHIHQPHGRLRQWSPGHAAGHSSRPARPVRPAPRRERSGLGPRAPRTHETRQGPPLARRVERAVQTGRRPGGQLLARRGRPRRGGRAGQTRLIT